MKKLSYEHYCLKPLNNGIDLIIRLSTIQSVLKPGGY